MPSNGFDCIRPANLAERAYLESFIDADYEHCHPGETLEDLKRRASFSKEEGLLRDWMAVAAARAAAEPAMARLLIAAE